jgi:hypothetical protein
MLYSAQYCPVCFIAGDVLFVKEPLSGRIFTYCPACGCTWKTPPRERLDSIEGLDVYAPIGIELPTRAEIHAAGFEGAIDREVDDEEWRSSLEAVLADGHNREPR